MWNCGAASSSVKKNEIKWMRGICLPQRYITNRNIKMYVLKTKTYEQTWRRRWNLPKRKEKNESTSKRMDAKNKCKSTYGRQRRRTPHTAAYNGRAYKRQTVIKQLLLLHRGLRQISLIIVKRANSRLHVSVHFADILVMLSCQPYHHHHRWERAKRKERNAIRFAHLIVSF